MTNDARTHKRPADTQAASPVAVVWDRKIGRACALEPASRSRLFTESEIGNGACSLLCPSDVHDIMAIASDESTRRTSTVALANHGLAVPEETTCDVTLIGDVTGRFGLVLERPQLTIVASGAVRCAEIESVYDADGPVARPDRVPEWVERVAQNFGIDEVTL